jgi:hypothetical protein
VTRKHWTKRELVNAWEQAGGTPTRPADCWRCGAPIVSPQGKTAQYGIDWHMGHVGVAHWAGGSEFAPEHVTCNMQDAAIQTKLAAKSVRIRANDIGITSKRKVPSRPKVPRKKTAWWCQEMEEDGDDAP